MDKVAKKFSLAPVFPVEIIRHVLLSLSPQELTSLQTVSKQFHAIINDPILWRTLYANAHLPRPPGPFPWQSTKLLQRTLVRSARVARRWTSASINLVPTRTLTLGSHEECRWVRGRWLIVCVMSRQLVSHDFDMGSEQMMCQWDNELISWSATCCEMSTRGLLLYVMLTFKQGDSGDRVKLLEFQVDGDSGHLSGPITYNVPMSLLDRDVSLGFLGGDSPLLFICVNPRRVHAEKALVFDTRSQIFYKFPELRSDLDIELLSRLRPGEITLTMTHVILRYLDRPSSTQFIQVYVVPDDDETRELRVSHETILPNSKLANWTLLRNSVIDPTTRSTYLQFLHTKISYHKTVFIRTDIILPQNSTSNILPIAIHMKVVYTVGNDERVEHILSSVDGFVRGLCVKPRVTTIRWCANETSYETYRGFQRFSIDATDELPRVEFIGDECSLSVPDDFSEREMSFDCTRGRICFTGVDRLSDGMPAALVMQFE